MNTVKKTNAAKTAVGAGKPARRLVPRTAPRPAVVQAAPAAAGESQEGTAAAVPQAAPAAAKARPPSRKAREDETVAKHQKVLADALQKAQAIKYDQPGAVKPPIVLDKKAAKLRKPKLVRDSYAMPEAEYARIGELKKRLLALDAPAKKSELLRGGIALLAALNDADLLAAMRRVERIKTGRPAKNARK